MDRLMGVEAPPSPMTYSFFEVWNPDRASGHEIDDESVMGGFVNIHHDTVVVPDWCVIWGVGGCDSALPTSIAARAAAISCACCVPYLRRTTPMRSPPPRGANEGVVCPSPHSDARQTALPLLRQQRHTSLWIHADAIDS